MRLKGVLASEPRERRRLLQDTALEAAVRSQLVLHDTTAKLAISARRFPGIDRLRREPESESQRHDAVPLAPSALGVYGVNDTNLNVPGFCVHDRRLDSAAAARVRPA
jgi:hypothetical protein